MSVTRQTFIRILLSASIALVSVSINQIALAVPSIVVTAVWHPGTQLATVDKNGNHQTDTLDGDDLRYVDLELDATTNVEFWTTELTCTVNKDVLESYEPGGDLVGTGDDVNIVTWAVDLARGDQLEQPFDPTTGSKTIASANVAKASVGNSEKTTSFPLVTIRYRVKAVTTPMTSTVVCTGSFLDTNGKVVAVPTFTMPPPLSIIPGYSISGNVSYQDRDVKSGILVNCATGATTIPTTTDANGNFVIQSRVPGNYACKYGGATSTHPEFAPDLYLQAGTTVALDTFSYKLLPVILPGGNLDRSAGSATEIDSSDIALVTANYGTAEVKGDINGDGKTDKTDLAIVAANSSLAEVFPASHVLYGMTRGAVSNSSHIWMSDAIPLKLTQLVPGTSTDNWPAVSPDGSKIMFTRRLGAGPNTRYALFVMNSDGTGPATQLTQTSGPNGSFDAFAASWSPDGSHIAFNCAVPSGWFVDDSSLCVIDSAGRNFRVLDNHVHIYPPTWRTNGSVLYGGNSKHGGHSGCTTPGWVCEAVLNFPNGSGVSAFQVLNIGLIDMPTISDGALFYRQFIAANGSGSYQYFRADLNTSGVVATPFSATSSPSHISLHIGRNDGDYLNVRPGSRDYLEGFFNGSRGAGYQAYLQSGPADYSFLGFSLPTAGDPDWNGIPESGSNIYALRNTFAWVP